MNRHILLLLVGAALVPAAAASNGPVLKGTKELRDYWIYDHATSLPLAEAAGMDIIVPPEMNRQAVPWNKTYAVRIDRTGPVISAECTDCAENDPVAPIVARGFFVERYTPAPGNTQRLPVQVLLPAELIPPAS